VLDKKSTAVLKSLNKLSEGCTYKVVTSDEIIVNLSQKNLYDHDNIKEIIDYLNKQEYLNLKFSEENTYCYTLLPKARIYLEQSSTNTKPKRLQFETKTYLFIMIASFIGCFLAMLIFFYLSF
jgi:phage-related protein